MFQPASNTTNERHAQLSLTNGLNAAKALTGSTSTSALTNLANAPVQDEAWAQRVDALLEPPVVSVALSDAAQKMMSAGPGTTNLDISGLAPPSGSLVSKTV